MDMNTRTLRFLASPAPSFRRLIDWLVERTGRLQPQPVPVPVPSRRPAFRFPA
jgi:hypothetical protein